jgi:hypothetical protein
VYLTCATNAPKTTCQVRTNDALNAYTVDFANATSGTVTVSVATTANAMVPPVAWRWRMKNGRSMIGVTGISIFLLVLLSLARRRRWASLVGVASLLVTVILLGCSGGSASSTPPPVPGGGTTPGSYTVTVNAYAVSGSGNKADASVTIPLTVN